MAPPVSPALLRIDDVANRLSVSRATTYRLIQRGILPVVHIGTTIRVPAEALDCWLRDQVQSTSPAERP